MSTRAARRAQGRAADRGRIEQTAPRAATNPATQHSRLRAAAFLVVVAVVVGAGLYYAGNIFFRTSPVGSTAMDMTGSSTIVAPATGAIDLRVSMDGFDPKVIKAKPGQSLTFEWWNTDGAMHLENGVHTMVSDSLGIRYQLAAQSKETISFKAPDKPGAYDYWCDSCCGGKDNPGMHARIEVEA